MSRRWWPSRGQLIEVDAGGTISIAGKPHSIGQHFAGGQITLRAHVSLTGVPAPTVPLTLSSTQRVHP